MVAHQCTGQGDAQSSMEKNMPKSGCVRQSHIQQTFDDYTTAATSRNVRFPCKWKLLGLFNIFIVMETA